MTFLKIMPYFTSTNAKYYKDFKYIAEYVSGDITIDKQALDVLNNSTPIELKVMDAPDVTRELNKKKVKLYNTNGASNYKYYYDGDAGYSFKVKCLITQNDKVSDGKTVYYYLNKLYTNNINVSVVIDTEVVPNGVYTISDCTNITLVRGDYYEIEIEFTKHTQLSQKLTNKCTILQTRLKACSYPKKEVLKHKTVTKKTKSGKKKKIKTDELVDKVYSIKKIDKASAKEKKKMQVGKCLQYVNEILYKKGFYGKGAENTEVIKITKKKVAGSKKIKKGKNKGKYKSKVTHSRKWWYNKYKIYWSTLSKQALKRFQKKWNKQGLKPTLNTKGTLSKNTWEALKRYTELK